MWLGHHVGQFEPVALLVCLPPLDGWTDRERQRRRRRRVRGGERGLRTDRDEGPEELVVPEKCAHVLHASLLLHAVANVGLEPGGELNTEAQTTCVIKGHMVKLFLIPGIFVGAHLVQSLMGLKQPQGCSQTPSWVFGSKTRRSVCDAMHRLCTQRHLKGSIALFDLTKNFYF